MNLTGLKREIDSLIQGVGDNFDQEICSQNGKLQTHSITLLMTRSDDKRTQDDMEELIPRLAMSDMAQQIPYDTLKFAVIQVQRSKHHLKDL